MSHGSSIRWTSGQYSTTCCSSLARATSSYGVTARLGSWTQPPWSVAWRPTPSRKETNALAGCSSTKSHRTSSSAKCPTHRAQYGSTANTFTCGLCTRRHRILPQATWRSWQPWWKAGSSPTLNKWTFSCLPALSHGYSQSVRASVYS